MPETTDATPPALTVLVASRAGDVAPGDVLPADDAEARLTALYAWPVGDGPSLRASMISTLDGAATGHDGRSGSINGPADLRVFTTLRSLCDVVLVGAGTARAEGYRAPRLRPALAAARRARGQQAPPALALVTARGDVPTEVLDDQDPPWVFTTDTAEHLPRLRDHLPSERLHVHAGTVDLARVVAALAGAGLPRVLAEGGPRLLADLLAAGLVDELCMTVAPVLVGGPASRVVAGEWLTPPVPAVPEHLLAADGVLLGRWTLTRD